MIGPEIMRAFRIWAAVHPAFRYVDRYACYPLYIGGSPSNGQWYVRERLPGTRVWRAEEDGGFRLLDAFDTPAQVASTWTTSLRE